MARDITSRKVVAILMRGTGDKETKNEHESQKRGVKTGDQKADDVVLASTWRTRRYR